MKKLIIPSLALGAVVALRPVVKHRMVQKMREHCRQMAAQHEWRREPVATA